MIATITVATTYEVNVVMLRGLPNVLWGLVFSKADIDDEPSAMLVIGAVRPDDHARRPFRPGRGDIWRVRLALEAAAT